MIRKKLKWAIAPVVAVVMIAGLSGFTAASEGGSDKHEATQTKTVTVTWTWNVTLKIWEIGGSGTRTKTETTTTTYKCCMSGASICIGPPCD